MVELVVAPEESSQGCATADTQHTSSQQSTTSATTSTTMLEPAARLPVLANTSFAATALRDLPTLTCAVQPNRSLPLRPAPPVPRRSTIGPPNQQQQQQQHRRLFSSDEDEKPQDENQTENKDSSSRLKKYLTQPITTISDKKESSSTRNSDGPRIIEDIVVDAAKMVPPLRLKKLAAAEQQEQSSPSSSSQVEEKKPSEDEQSNYCIVKEASPTSNGLTQTEKKMGGEKIIGGGGEEPKSIEIVIPSIPELGIKETRTDMRVNVPQDPAAGRPFIVNYVLAKDGKYPTVLPLNVKLPGVVTQTSTKNPDPGGTNNNNNNNNNNSGSKSEPNLTPSPASSSGEKLSVRSMPLLGLEDNDEVQIIPLTSRSHDGSPTKPSINEISPSEKRRKWYVRREQLREKFRELRAQAIEMRTQIDASRSVLPEDSADRPKFQKIIDDCDARINDYSNKLRKLNEVVSAEKFHVYCDEVGEEKVYDDEPQEDKTRSSNELIGKMSPMNELQRRTPNGYYATTTTTIQRDVDRATATYVVRSKPPNGMITTSQQQQQRRGYSSFSIDELSAAPRTNATRAPANSPREALVPGAWVESQPGTSAGGTDVEKRPLDLATKRAASQEEMVKEDRRKRRRVSDVSITHWPAGFVQPQLVQQHPQQHRGGHEVFTLPAQPSRLYPYVPEATIWSPNGIIVQHREQPANLGERLVRNLDYRALWHDKPVSSVVNERQPLPADYVMAVQRMHESAVTPEQAKARESTIVKTKPAMQQQPPPPQQPQSSKVVSDSVVTKTANLDLLDQTASSKNNTTHDQQQQQQHPQQQQRIMAEQFPIFGMWADALKRQSNPDKKDVDTRQAYYQIPGTGVYKPITNANAMPTANYVSNGVPIRWPETTRPSTVHQVQSVVPPPQQQQQQQSATSAGGQSDVQRHQAYYPASMAVAYPHKFPLELYQKASSLGYPYPYATPIAYTRMPLEATATITSQSRVPPLIPLGGNPTAASAAQWDPEKRTLAVPTPQHHFYSPPPPPQPQAPGGGGEARYARRGSLVDYNGNPMLSAEQAARLREAYEQRHYQQSNAEQVARQQQQQQARAVASGKPQAYAQPNVARNGTSSTTNSSHYNNSSQQQRASTSSTSYAKQSNGNYERECPTPNLGEVNRSPSGVQSLRCSNCGAPSSRFECLGCETTFYCNEACQAQHWSVHGAQCPKIMPRLKKLA